MIVPKKANPLVNGTNIDFGDVNEDVVKTLKWGFEFIAKKLDNLDGRVSEVEQQTTRNFTSGAYFKYESGGGGDW